MIPSRMSFDSTSGGGTPASWAARLRRVLFELRTEGGGAGRDALAAGLGILIGCTPFYGFHFVLSWLVGLAVRPQPPENLPGRQYFEPADGAGPRLLRAPGGRVAAPRVVSRAVTRDRADDQPVDLRARHPGRKPGDWRDWV